MTNVKYPLSILFNVTKMFGNTCVQLLKPVTTLAIISLLTRIGKVLSRPEVCFYAPKYVNIL